MPKWIIKPEPATFAGAEQYFDGFLDQLVSDPSHWGTSMSLVRRGTRVADACRGVPTGEAFVVDDQDHALLLATLERPHQPWIPVAMRALDSFARAIEDATDKAP